MTPEECSALVRATWPDREWTDEEVLNVVFNDKFFCWEQKSQRDYAFVRTPTPHMAELQNEREAWNELIRRTDGAMYEAERADALAAPQQQKLPLRFAPDQMYASISAAWAHVYFQRPNLFHLLPLTRLEQLNMKMEIPDVK